MIIEQSNQPTKPPKKPQKRQIDGSFAVFYSLLSNPDISPETVGTINATVEHFLSPEGYRRSSPIASSRLSSNQVTGAQATLAYLLQTKHLQLSELEKETVQNHLEETRQQLAKEEKNARRKRYNERKRERNKRKQKENALSLRRARRTEIRETFSSALTAGFEKNNSLDVRAVRVLRRGAVFAAIMGGVDMLTGNHIPIFNQGLTGIEFQLILGAIQQAYIIARSWKGWRRDF